MGACRVRASRHLARQRRSPPGKSGVGRGWMGLAATCSDGVAKHSAYGRSSATGRFIASASFDFAKDLEHHGRINFVDRMVTQDRIGEVEKPFGLRNGLVGPSSARMRNVLAGRSSCFSFFACNGSTPFSRN